MFTRRNWLATTIAAAGGAAVAGKAAAQQRGDAYPPLPPSRRERGRTSVTTPNGASLPFTLDGDVKVFHLVAAPMKREFSSGLIVDTWGYNGSTPGPTIEAIEGDRVRILVENRLPESTSIHWHGVILPNGMDGVAGLTQPKIRPGETYAYEFTLKQNGTLMYHPHLDEMTQAMLGMHGFFIVHPRDAAERRVDRDFAIFLAEWFVKPGTSKPDPTVMNDFNLFTMNSRVFPGTEPLVVRRGERVRIRFANLSMSSHPIHIHGHRMLVTGTDAGPLPRSAWWAENTINVPVGSTRDIEFVADNPGDWPLHCHKSHHTMNQMGHGLPNMLGVDSRGLNEQTGAMVMGTSGMEEMAEHEMPAPRNSIPMRGAAGPFGNIDMGGMFTIIKIRDGITSYEDPGWYEHPQGTVSWRVR